MTNVGLPRIKPHKVIGPLDNPYMYRWFIFKVGKLPRVYLHRFLRSDEDRALHNHPWWFVSILLRGSYIEHNRGGPVRRSAPSIAYRGLDHDHRVELVPGKPVWTLFITGPVRQPWGFWCTNGTDEHLVPWREFDGCDE